MRWLLAAAALGLLAAGCASSEGPDLSLVDAATLTVIDSCGRSFTNRDEAGTTRLTVRAPDIAEAIEPGSLLLDESGWTAELEVGTGLLRWPCDDAATELGSEEVAVTLQAIGGTLQLVDQVPAPGAEGVIQIRAVLLHAVFEGPDGKEVTVDNVKLYSPVWGIFAD